jgi:hypothetical protein
METVSVVSDIVIATELSADRLLQEIVDLSPSHWREFGEGSDRHELAPDLTSYMRMYDNGKLLATTARRDGVLVGYQLLICNRHPHRDTLTLSDAITFLRTDVPMRGLVLARMIRHTINNGRVRGVTYFRMRVKLKHNYGKLLERFGFRPVELAYALEIEGTDRADSPTISRSRAQV